jgi:hypothetical protein
MSAEPRIEFVRQACPRCGAQTGAEAKRMCDPIVHCPSTGETDKDGFLVAVTPESIAACAAWEKEQD